MKTSPPLYLNSVCSSEGEVVVVQAVLVGLVVAPALPVDREELVVFVGGNAARAFRERERELNGLVDPLGVAIPFVEALTARGLLALAAVVGAIGRVDGLLVRAELVFDDAGGRRAAREGLKIGVPRPALPWL